MSAPGPDLDARLAEAMGHKVCRDQLCEGCDAEWYVPYQSNAEGWETNTAGVNFSTDPAAAISAAEEMRKAGRLKGWQVGCNGLRATAFVALTHRDIFAEGDCPAHALCLALLAALEAR